jgi:hypothetical protein
MEQVLDDPETRKQFEALIPPGETWPAAVAVIATANRAVEGPALGDRWH